MLFNMKSQKLPPRLFILTAFLVLVVVGYWQFSSSNEEDMDMSSRKMPDAGEMVAMPDAPPLTNLAPLVKGYYDGGELFFVHTEASDRQVATLMTEMMGPLVVLVPELAEIPASLQAVIYVFQNGVDGMGPRLSAGRVWIGARNRGLQPNASDSTC